MEAPLRWPSSGSGAHALCVVGFLPIGALSSIVENVSLRDLGSAYLLDGEGRIISVADYASRIKLFGQESAGAVVDNFATREIAAGRAGHGPVSGLRRHPRRRRLREDRADGLRHRRRAVD